MKSILAALVTVFSVQAMASSTAVIRWSQNYVKGLSINDSLQEEVSDNRRVLEGVVKGTQERCLLAIKEDVAPTPTAGQIMYRLATDGTNGANFFLNYTPAGRIDPGQAAAIFDGKIGITNIDREKTATFVMRIDNDGLIYEAYYGTSLGDKLECTF